ncbi:D-alanyl-D-alanine carboxypeptidase family protein [Ruminococcus albus]|uniref:serine-type D-Ala-D-Ala carboxypeptidase n=1 Tax=Ruminococcus albus TaxID=1264 RepID=A0A1H7L468_RUMAL|nr:serine hydrolase [Ruminococcus albus]SEK93863.1 D-alanyl-D-alanine carboxypeptidase (penicillin-binding protein 5/6) [Ruminococcus albus]
MGNIKKIFILFVCLTMLCLLVPKNTSAETVSIEDMLEAMPAEEIIAVECSTGQMLMEKNSAEVREVSHLAKLMLALLAAEKIEKGELSLTDTVTVSAKANSMPAPQIWLDKNEKITAEELIKAITISNANDAAVALAEYIFGSTDEAVDDMNTKAKSLDMISTTYADVCGLDERTLSNAADTAILASEFVKHDILTPYFTSWIDHVRDGKAELVNLNRLVRTYKGITGLKACSSSSAGECTVVTAKRGKMEIAVVVLGCTDRTLCDDIAKKLLDMCFDMYSLYIPEITEDMLENIPVLLGEKSKVSVGFDKLPAVVVPKGSSASFDISFDKVEELSAPVKKGQVCGKLECRYGDQVIYSADLVAEWGVKQKTFAHCMKILLNYLLKI